MSLHPLRDALFVAAPAVPSTHDSLPVSPYFRIQNRPCQLHAVHNHRLHKWRRLGDVITCEPDGGNDAGRNHTSRRESILRSSSSRAIALRISPINENSALISPASSRATGRQPASEDVWRQVGATFAAQGTLSHNPRIRHRLNRGRDVLSAALAGHRVLADR